MISFSGTMYALCLSQVLGVPVIRILRRACAQLILLFEVIAAT
jgi:hypothetical protein